MASSSRSGGTPARLNFSYNTPYFYATALYFAILNVTANAVAAAASGTASGATANATVGSTTPVAGISVTFPYRITLDADIDTIELALPRAGSLDSNASSVGTASNA